MLAMTSKHGFERYVAVATDAVIPLIERVTSGRKEVMEEGLLADFLGNARPAVPAAQLSEDEQFLHDIFSQVTEISFAWEALLDTSVYVRRYPYSGTRVTKGRHLRHSIEAFLHNLYVFKERIGRHLDFIQKRYKSTRRVREVQKEVAAVRELMEETLRFMVDYRGSHVHVARFSTDDLERLESLEFLSAQMCDSAITSAFEREFKRSRREWQRILTTAFEAYGVLLDVIGDRLRSLAFAGDGTPKLPSQYR
jgi:hypothetical protein